MKTEEFAVEQSTYANTIVQASRVSLTRIVAKAAHIVVTAFAKMDRVTCPCGLS